MAHNPAIPSAARTKAEGKFANQGKSNRSFQETIDQERAAREKKNERLRALRLEKEAREAEEARVLAAAAPPKPARKSRSRAKKSN